MPDWPWYARFRPIEQWPGEPTKQRRSSQFSASWSATLNLLDRELTQLGSKNVVIQVALSERDIRLDGYPRANARPDHPGVIVSLDSAYGPLSYPCDTFYDWRDNLRAIALALEALRSVDRYGVTKRGEQYTGWRQIESGSMTRDAAAVHLAAAADPHATMPHLITQLREGRMLDAAYRMAAKRLHPDAGGTAERFQEITEAKRVLEGS